MNVRFEAFKDGKNSFNLHHEKRERRFWHKLKNGKRQMKDMKMWIITDHGSWSFCGENSSEKLIYVFHRPQKLFTLKKFSWEFFAPPQQKKLSQLIFKLFKFFVFSFAPLKPTRKWKIYSVLKKIFIKWRLNHKWLGCWWWLKGIIKFYFIQFETFLTFLNPLKLKSKSN